ncbi:STE/STE7/MEK1 protein kinase [Nannizzia gypsea CBS 118893]|uniref:STE/STE7/MEK1 protein kinase n=1 Tax=Arthroderma gypseum (strain ATCC MYA-4604 / CBS 118893) TaxID=535722 RepID=E4UWZ7_ARTGP|nr:STE/STE7/MEK1 protein kinase [Nannizzia gypsea CBS 118893]EFR02636.1 STE/STE7/MEK1 protein kinase [Nannizzia gypsea CBS 118893]
MADAFKARSLKRKNVKGLALNATTAKPGLKPSDGDAQIPGAIGNVDANRTDTLEIGLEFKLDLRSEDLIVLKELGAGNGGTVSKVMHASTKVVMARKIIRVDAKEKVRKQILRELQVGHDCNSVHIVTFYGAFQNEARDIVLCMEYMDCGSLDHISKNFGPVRVDVLGKITESIFAGLIPFDTSDTSAGDRASAGPMGILDLLQQIVHEPAPKLPKSDAFPKILDDFVAKCLLKKPEERPTPRQLYDHDAFILAAKRTPVNLREWAISMMEQHNRKSYLAPPAPKAITRDGGSGESPSSSSPHTPDDTPRQATSGDIPLNIAGDITPRSRPQASYGIDGSSSMGFEKLSLNTQGQVPRSSRSPYPHSATSTSQGPFAAPRPAPSPVYHSTRNGSQSAGLPHLAGPPPKGPLPVPPSSDTWRNQQQNRI